MPDFGVTVTFKCPKCGEKIKMRETRKHHLTQTSKSHMRPYSEEEYEETVKTYERLIEDKETREVCKEQGINLEEELEETKKMQEERKKKYCMMFREGRPLTKTFEKIFDQELPLVFSKIDKRFDDKKTLKVALKALKKGKLGLEIEIPLKNKLASCHIWKYGDKFYGKEIGIKTPVSIIATSNFDEVEEFAKRWYNWV